jgi:hypothetical protein
MRQYPAEPTGQELDARAANFECEITGDRGRVELSPDPAHATTFELRG